MVHCGTVRAVCRQATHTFSKEEVGTIRVLAGLGVEGDAHMGVTVKHRSRVARDPNEPNLRQVHVIHGELLDELNALGFNVLPGQMGENVTTEGVNLLGMPVGTQLMIGQEAVVELTGLRNPCRQIDEFRAGLLKAVVDIDETGTLIRKAGVMGIVLTGGEIRPGDAIRWILPNPPYRPLEPV